MSCAVCSSENCEQIESKNKSGENFKKKQQLTDEYLKIERENEKRKEVAIGKYQFVCFPYVNII